MDHEIVSMTGFTQQQEPFVAPMIIVKNRAALITASSYVVKGTFELQAKWT